MFPLLLVLLLLSPLLLSHTHSGLIAMMAGCQRRELHHGGEKAECVDTWQLVTPRTQNLRSAGGRPWKPLQKPPEFKGGLDIQRAITKAINLNILQRREEKTKRECRSKILCPFFFSARVRRHSARRDVKGKVWLNVKSTLELDKVWNIFRSNLGATARTEQGGGGEEGREDLKDEIQTQRRSLILSVTFPALTFFLFFFWRVNFMHDLVTFFFFFGSWKKKIIFKKRFTWQGEGSDLWSSLDLKKKKSLCKVGLHLRTVKRQVGRNWW